MTLTALHFLQEDSEMNVKSSEHFKTKSLILSFYFDLFLDEICFEVISLALHLGQSRAPLNSFVCLHLT